MSERRGKSQWKTLRRSSVQDRMKHRLGEECVHELWEVGSNFNVEGLIWVINVGIRCGYTLPLAKGKYSYIRSKVQKID